MTRCEAAAKLGTPAVSVPAPATSQICPRCGDRHPDNRESQAVFRCRNCGLYAHADWTAAVIICNRAYVGIPKGSPAIPLQTHPTRARTRANSVQASKRRDEF